MTTLCLSILKNRSDDRLHNASMQNSSIPMTPFEGNFTVEDAAIEPEHNSPNIKTAYFDKHPDFSRSTP